MFDAQISDFSIEVPAKWVLSGEHSVLRGKRAIAFPHPQFVLKLSFREQEHFSITDNPFHSELKQLIGRACRFLEKDPALFSTGEIDIQSQIPMGAGLGSSAALSVAIARLVIWKTGASLEHWIPLATHLEDVFHGKSSGMDVNVIAHSLPILFSMERPAEILTVLRRIPRFELHDSGMRGHTKLCIQRVSEWKQAHSEIAESYDEKMGEATEAALRALLDFEHNPVLSELALAGAMNAAQNCFETWGLVPEQLLMQKQDLLKQGALAVKLTGAGLGGFWVALWPSPSPALDNVL